MPGVCYNALTDYLIPEMMPMLLDRPHMLLRILLSVVILLGLLWLSLSSWSPINPRVPAAYRSLPSTDRLVLSSRPPYEDLLSASAP